MQYVNITQEQIEQRAKLFVDTTEELLMSMERKGITKEQMAQNLGLTDLHMLCIFNGSKPLALEMLSDICYFLDATPKVTLYKSENVSNDR